jgi:hypothetical protein
MCRWSGGRALATGSFCSSGMSFLAPVRTLGCFAMTRTRSGQNAARGLRGREFRDRHTGTHTHTHTYTHTCTHALPPHRMLYNRYRGGDASLAGFKMNQRRSMHTVEVQISHDYTSFELVNEQVRGRGAEEGRELDIACTLVACGLLFLSLSQPLAPLPSCHPFSSLHSHSLLTLLTFRSWSTSTRTETRKTGSRGRAPRS